MKLTSDKYYLFYDDNVVDDHASVICVSSEIYLIRVKLTCCENQVVKEFGHSSSNLSLKSLSDALPLLLLALNGCHDDIKTFLKLVNSGLANSF